MHGSNANTQTLEPLMELGGLRRCLILQTRAWPIGAILMAFSIPGRGPSAPQINVTPLIDVLLTLIIMFMLVVSMDPEYVEKAQIPQPDQKRSDAGPTPRTVIIQVVWTAKDQPPSIKINQEDVAWPELEVRLARIYLTRVEKVAFVRGDAEVAFQYVASVIDLAHQAGVQRIGLLTQGQKMAGE